jgi:hypothetical protein
MATFHPNLPSAFDPFLPFALRPVAELAYQRHHGRVARFSNRQPQTLGAAYWAVQPRWVRVLVVLVMLPAWLVLAFGVFTGGLPSAVENAAIALFVCVGVIELGYLARAYWRLDL